MENYYENLDELFLLYQEAKKYALEKAKHFLCSFVNSNITSPLALYFLLTVLYHISENKSRHSIVYHPQTCCGFLVKYSAYAECEIISLRKL